MVSKNVQLLLIYSEDRGNQGGVDNETRYGSGGKSSRLAVGGLPVRSHPGCVEVSLSKTPNPQLLLTSWLVPCMAANRRWCVNVCVNGWMRGINCTALCRTVNLCNGALRHAFHQLGYLVRPIRASFCFMVYFIRRVGVDMFMLLISSSAQV